MLNLFYNLQKMKKLIIFLTAAFVAAACTACSGEDNKGNDGESFKYGKVKGADIGWATQLEDKGVKFVNFKGEQKNCTAVMKDVGFNAIRLRVWVDSKNSPEEKERGYYDIEDVLKQARRAVELGMDIMIDFHYSDTWADPGKQIKPKSWEGKTADEIALALSEHTAAILSELKANEIPVKWVQVGNELDNGMIWPEGEIFKDVTSGFNETKLANFIKFFNAGYEAAKSVYPQAQIIMHRSNGTKTGEYTWYFEEMSKRNVRFDVIGMSVYPSYWDQSINAFPDWKPGMTAAVASIKAMAKYSKPVMICEVGMPESEPAKAKAAIEYLMKETAGIPYCQGMFYWEPEGAEKYTGYAYSGFSDRGDKVCGPTSCMSPFYLY